MILLALIVATLFGFAVGWVTHAMCIDGERIDTDLAEFERYVDQALEVAEPTPDLRRIR